MVFVLLVRIALALVLWQGPILLDLPDLARLSFIFVSVAIPLISSMVSGCGLLYIGYRTVDGSSQVRKYPVIGGLSSGTVIGMVILFFLAVRKIP